MSLVLGIDPGLAHLGYGAVIRDGSTLRAVTFGVITTTPGAALEQRLARIERELEAVIGTLPCPPARMAVEELYFNQNVSSAMDVAHARATALLAAGRRDVPVDHLTPQQIKQAACGSSRAGKTQVHTMVARLLGLEAAAIGSDHAADALAAALAGQARGPLQAAVRRAVAG